MSEVFYRINYYFNGFGWTDKLKRLAANDFMRIRSEWVEVVNPLYEIANEQWRKLHPEIKNCFADEMEQVYLTYIADFMKPVEKRLNAKRHSKLFKAATNPETGDFRLIFRFCPKMTVDYDMSPICTKES